MPYHDTLICRLLSHKIGHSASVRVPSGKLLRIFTRHDPARGGIWSQVFQNLAGRVQPGTELIEISRVGSGRVGSGRVVSGRVGSCRVVSGRVGSGRIESGRVTLVRHEVRGVTRPVKIPHISNCGRLGCTVLRRPAGRSRDPEIRPNLFRAVCIRSLNFLLQWLSVPYGRVWPPRHPPPGEIKHVAECELTA